MRFGSEYIQLYILYMTVYIYMTVEKNTYTKSVNFMVLELHKLDKDQVKRLED